MGEAPTYRELEHTGDLAIEVTAATREELFAHSLVAMARLMVEEDGIVAAERREIRCDAGDDADAIRDLLAAALNLAVVQAEFDCFSNVPQSLATSFPLTDTPWNYRALCDYVTIFSGHQYDRQVHCL